MKGILQFILFVSLLLLNACCNCIPSPDSESSETVTGGEDGDGDGDKDKGKPEPSLKARFGEVKEGLFRYSLEAAWGPVGVGQIKKGKGDAYVEIVRESSRKVVAKGYNARKVVQWTHTYTLSKSGKTLTQKIKDRFDDPYLKVVFKEIKKGRIEKTSTYKSKENALSPCAKRRIERSGKVERDTCLTRSGKARPDKDGVTTIEREEVGKGDNPHLNINVKNFDADDKALVDSYGVHKIRFKHDKLGCLTEKSFFDDDGAPTVNSNGVHKVKWENNKACVVLTKEMYGPSGRVADGNGVFRYVNTVNNGLVTKVSYFNTNDARIEKPSLGAHSIAYQYDSKGNRLTISYLGLANLPKDIRSGYHQLRQTFNSSNMLETQSYFKSNGKPATNKGSFENVHKLFYVRDKYNNLVTKAFFNTRGKRTKDKLDRVFMVKYKYDDLYRVVSTSYWKDPSTPMRRWNGFHEQVNVYTSKGLVKEARMQDKDGELIKNRTGFSRRVMKYNESDEVVSYTYYDRDEPVVTKGTATVRNYHRIAIERDPRGIVQNVRYFGTDAPIEAKVSGISNKVHRVKFIYDGNRLVSQQIFPVDGNIPDRTVDCTKNRCISSNGINIR